MIEASRRSVISGLVALIAAPAIVRASSLMPVKSLPNSISMRRITDYVADQEMTRLDVLFGHTTIRPEWSVLSPAEITRASVELFNNSNLFLRNIDEQYKSQFSAEGAKIGSTLRIRLPNDFHIIDKTTLVAADPALSVPEMTTIGAAVVLAKNPSISRRFWA